MYKNKIMIISSVLVVGLLGVMIWSSHVVADNHANKMKEAEEQVADKEAQDEFLREHVDNNNQAEPELPASEMSVPQADSAEPLVIDRRIIEPQIMDRVVKVNRVDINYLDKISDMKQLVLWNTSTFPLKVYLVDEQNISIYFANGVKAAFSNWQAATNELVSFQFVDNPAGADIVVSFPDDPSNATCPDGGGLDKNLIINGSKLHKAEIKVPLRDCDGNSRNVPDLYAYVQHYVGHILGIDGHSDNVSDVMYPKLSYENVNITDSDVNTLMYLYKFRPDVTNKPYPVEEAKKKLRFAEIRNKSAAEIEAYLNKYTVQKAKVTPLDKMLESAVRYLNQKNYDMAMTYFSRSLQMASDKFDKAYIYRGMCITLLHRGREKDLPKALEYAKETYTLVNSPANDYLLGYMEYRIGDEAAALERLERIMHDYPKLKAPYSLAAQIYEKNGNQDKINAIAKQAKDNFFENPPVIVNEVSQESAQ